jgi:O-acetylhomoserine/O-acetylserine sulfhydrylase
MRAEFEASQKKSPMNSLLSGGGGGGQQAENPLGNFDMAAYLAGSSKKETGSAAAGESGTKAKNQGVRR